MQSNSRYERAILKARSLPGCAAMLKAAYLDERIEEAAGHYAASAEFTSVMNRVRSHFGNVRKLSVLDVGGGRGIASFAFALQGYEVTLVEVDTSGIVGTGAGRELQEKTGTRFRIVEGAVESSLGEETFDLVFCRQVLHHARDLMVMTQVLRKLVRPGGLFLAIREHIVRASSDLPKFLSHHASSILGDMEENAYKKSYYMEALRKAGFREVRCSPFFSSGEYEALSSIRRILFRLHVYVRPYPGCEYTFWASG